MSKNILFAALAAVVLAVCIWFVFHDRPELATIDASARRIGQLTEPVELRALVYDANQAKPELRKVEVARGTWLVPESMLSQPD